MNNAYHVSTTDTGAILKMIAKRTLPAYTHTKMNGRWLQLCNRERVVLEAQLKYEGVVTSEDEKQITVTFKQAI